MIKFCNLFSGSSGNCTFVSSKNTKILVDAGVSCLKISKALAELDVSLDEIDAILVTHEHVDHIKGITTIVNKYHVPIYASEKTWKMMNSLKVPDAYQLTFEPNNLFNIGDFDIYPFSIPHDAADPCGFSLSCENKKVTIATDMGYIDNTILEQMEKSDVLLLESNYDVETLKCSPYPFFLKQRISGKNGHLSNDVAGKAICHLCQKGVNNIILGHLSKENNFPELAYQTVLNELQQRDLSCNLSVANRDKIDDVLELA